MKKVLKRVIGALALISLLLLIGLMFLGVSLDFYQDYGWHFIWVLPLTLISLVGIILLLGYLTTWLLD